MNQPAKPRPVRPLEAPEFLDPPSHGTNYRELVALLLFLAGFASFLCVGLIEDWALAAVGTGLLMAGVVTRRQRPASRQSTDAVGLGNSLASLGAVMLVTGLVSLVLILTGVCLALLA
jgi:hypothetical protein